jgi:HSP20 family protein
MQVVTYDPARDIRQLEQDVRQFWGGNLGLLPAIAGSPAMDMYEENGSLIAEVTMPNFTKDEITVDTDHGVLEIAAEHHERKEDKKQRHYFVRESSNQYMRRVSLPEEASADQAEASFENGKLKVIIPLATRKPNKPIPVK